MSGLFNPPKVPKTPKQIPMLTADEAILKKTRRAKAAELLTRSGRASTIMTQPGELGG